MRSIVYHQFRKELHIIKTLVLYIIKPTVFYTHLRCDEIQHGIAVLMIYTLKRDDIPSLSAWIKKHSFKRTSVFWRYHPDLNRGIKVLQTFALPLGHGTILYIMHKFLKCAAFSNKGRKIYCVLFLERITRLELATSTLARWRSTR